VRIIEKINEIESSGKKVQLFATISNLQQSWVVYFFLFQIAQDKKEMIKNVIRQLNTKIEQKQLAVAAAAQTDATHMTRMKEVASSPVPAAAHILFLPYTSVSDSSLQDSG
jgi:hypothetical protein